MAAAELPEDGAVEIGGLSLPAGKRAYAVDARGSGGSSVDWVSAPVAWITAAVVPLPGRIWSQLAEHSQGTGLVPFLAKSMDSDASRPWDSRFDFNLWGDLADLDRINPADVLADGWAARAEVIDDEDDETREWIEQKIAPFSAQFPGLAPAVTDRVSQSDLQRALDALPPARIGLAVASRPADVLPAIGWNPANWIDGKLPVTAVLRSWEDRFGARLLEVGMAEFKVLAERPPHSLAAAQRLAAEHVAFADECFYGLDPSACDGVAEIAERLVAQPIWGFWWD
jgi:Domain of unknown function (DUF4253)